MVVWSGWHHGFREGAAALAVAEIVSHRKGGRAALRQARVDAQYRDGKRGTGSARDEAAVAVSSGLDWSVGGRGCSKFGEL